MKKPRSSDMGRRPMPRRSAAPYLVGGNNSPRTPLFCEKSRFPAGNTGLFAEINEVENCAVFARLALHIKITYLALAFLRKGRPLSFRIKDGFGKEVPMRVLKSLLKVAFGAIVEWLCEKFFEEF